VGEGYVEKGPGIVTKHQRTGSCFRFTVSYWGMRTLVVVLAVSGPKRVHGILSSIRMRNWKLAV
jgi:hypothetical protein